MAGKRQADSAAPADAFTTHGSRFAIHDSAALGTPAWLLFGIIAAGAVLRGLRLGWQPLWWDEGYSVYFGTEPLARMLWLTARDIHPPLYYALLHGWTLLRQSAEPVTTRTLSIFFGIAALPLIDWLGRLLLPQRPRVARLALLLLLVNPMHLFYSQEVRMYGLAMALGLASTAFLWRAMACADRGSPGAALRTWPALGYLLTSIAALYTLYYSALLLLAHFVWAAWHWRRRLAAMGSLIAIDLLLLLAYLPWLFYAVPQLIGYVGGKVQSDQDTPLGLLAYAERHLVAFTIGHVRPPWLSAHLWMLALPTIGICALILGLVLRQTMRPEPAGDHRPAGSMAAEPDLAVGALWTWLLAPLAAGWLINLRFPFFPAGGERMLLLVLPYFLLLLAVAADRTWATWQLGKIAVGTLVAGSLLGVAAFYTTPRYTADDYRPILRQIVQQGTNDDTLLAIFPWQVGYWRAYVPQQDPLLKGPQPLLLGDGAVAWSPQVQATVDDALSTGTLWFPAPLTFGSTLPPAIETYLAGQAVNLQNRWYDATRLTGWHSIPSPATQPVLADFGAIRLLAGGVGPSVAASANTPVAVSLVWEKTGSEDLNVSLRIQSADGSGTDQVWSSREYLAAPRAGAGVYTETVGLLVPVGLPPGAYQVAVSVQTAGGTALTMAGSDAIAAPVGTLAVVQPERSQSSMRLPVQRALDTPATDNGLSIIGLSGVHDRPILAGASLGVTLFLANKSDAPPDRQLYVSLQDAGGAGVAGYAGWPLPDYPTATWLPGAAVQAPVAFFLPGTLTTGDYRLVAGFLEPATGARRPPVELAKVAVEQRVAVFDRPTIQTALSSPAQFGTHARLLGYDLATADDGTARLKLHWEVTQPLLPPHHIFVHADAASGTTVAQQDGPPVTATGVAPSGSWQPGEFLTTEHTLRLPDGEFVTGRVGLYDPRTGVRLPVTIDGAPAGDNVAIMIP